MAKPNNPNTDPYFLLFYESGPDYIEKRAPFRKTHLEFANSLADEGLLVLGGAFQEPVNNIAAIIAFQAKDIETVEEIAKKDPYVTNGIVAKWYVKPWTVVTGSLCANPIDPSQL